MTTSQKAEALIKTFESLAGLGTPLTERQVFVVKLCVSTDATKENGHRWVELALYAKDTYVTLYTRRSWRVVPTEVLAKQGYLMEVDYTEGDSGWHYLLVQDSWEKTVHQFLKEVDPFGIAVDDFSGPFYQLTTLQELGIGA
jgi:hypothetical protein